MSSSVWAIFCSQESVSATTWEMWHLSVAGGVDGAGRVEIDIARRAERVVRAQDRLERRRAVGRGDDGLVDAVGGVVRELDQAAAVAGRCCP